MIWDEDIEDERREWVEWLENDSVPADAKKDKLYHRYKGWTSIHHAARYSRTQILGCAADVDGGENYTQSTLYIYIQTQE